MSTALFALIALRSCSGSAWGCSSCSCWASAAHDRRRDVHDEPRNRAESASRRLLVGMRNPLQAHQRHRGELMPLIMRL